eukprot:6011775-Lingulodinium_polyedra.AAC.1
MANPLRGMGPRHGPAHDRRLQHDSRQGRRMRPWNESAGWRDHAQGVAHRDDLKQDGRQDAG